MRGRISHIRRNRRGVFCTALLASTVLAGIPAAFADDAGAPPVQGTLETITVTAEKAGEEDLQKVPLSIQVLDAEKISELHLTDFTDFALYLPSVSYTAGGQGSGGGPGFDTISMRGVTNGNDGNHSGPLPTVGVYLDELPISTIGGTLDVPTYDIQRVEALAGPQGTLYGASSEAGTIRIITNKPDPSGFSAGIEAQGNTVDHGGAGYTFDGFVNEPITDNVAIRLVGWEEHDAGYIDNVPGTRTYPTTGVTINNYAIAKDNYNTVDKLGGRAELGIDLDDNWTITPTIMGQLESTNGVFGYDPSVGVLKVQHYYPDYVHDHWYQAGLTIEGKIGDLDLTYSGGYMDRRDKGEADYTDYTFWYDKLDGYYFTDNAGNPVDSSQYIIAQDQFTKLSNELRISSPTGDRLHWVAGLFQERQTHYILQDYKINALGSDFWVDGWPNTIWLTDQLRVDRDLAAFGEVTFDITPSLSLTGGVRVFQADNSLIGFFGFGPGTDALFGSSTGEASCFSSYSVRNAPCENLDKRVTETGETHKFNLTWQIDDEDMVYATYSTGFRPGGINRYGSLPPYQSDELDNYELGWKTSWLDNTLRWNGAVYWENWNDFQFAFLGINSLTQITNGGQAQIQGIESDVTWAPTSDFTLSTSGAFNNARLTEVYCGDLDPVTGKPDTSCTAPYGPLQAPAGQELPSTPRFKGNLTARYEFDFFSLPSHFQGSAVYQTSSWPDLRNIRTLLGRMPGFISFDFTLGAQLHDNTSIELGVQNAFDERGELYRYAACTTQVCGYEPYVLPIKPRVFSLTLAQKF
jgi:iron complex outermembrane recepter protein